MANHSHHHHSHGGHLVHDQNAETLSSHDHHHLWLNGTMPFHLSGPNPRLVSNVQVLEQDGDRRVFVPCCGKSVDMIWLKERGFEVHGIELEELAVRQFFEENSLQYDVEESAHFRIYVSKDRKLRILQGDMLKLTLADFGGVPFTNVWDRASFEIVKEGGMQKRYLKILADITVPGARVVFAEIWPSFILRERGGAGDKSDSEKRAVKRMIEITNDFFETKLIASNPAGEGYEDQHSHNYDFNDLTFLAIRR